VFGASTGLDPKFRQRGIRYCRGGGDSSWSYPLIDMFVNHASAHSISLRADTLTIGKLKKKGGGFLHKDAGGQNPSTLLRDLEKDKVEEKNGTSNWVRKTG